MCAIKEALEKLQLPRNKACRVILEGQKRDHIVDMHKDLNILLLDPRRELHLEMSQKLLS